jgi:predicted dehydrogenase
MNQRLRFAVIGTGLMGCEHLRHLAVLPDIDVVACADPDAGSRRQAAMLAPDAELYEDYHALLGRRELDAVIIATPNFTHASVLDAVLDTSLHVLIEKPLCTTLQDARRVAERARSHKGVFWVGLEYRYSEPLLRLVDELRSGRAGRLQMLSIREHRQPFLPKVGDWNRFSRNTGGTLVEKCCHFFDLMRLITAAEPLRIYASGGQNVNHLDERYDGETPDILDNAFVTVDFPGGVRAMLDLCMFAEAGLNHEDIVIVGDRGKLQCLLPQGTIVIGDRATRGVQRHPVAMDPKILELGGHYGATYGELKRFCAAIRLGTRAEVTADDGLRSVAMGIAAHLSIDQGRPIDFVEVLNQQS